MRTWSDYKRFNDAALWIEGCDRSASWIEDVDLESTSSIEFNLESTLLVSGITY